MRVEISKYYMYKIEAFALERVSGSKDLYKSRASGKTNNSKLRTDIVAGAMGEVAVYKHLKSLGIKCSKPDLTIYEKGKKSFSPDLQSDDLKIHVKSQTIESVKKYGNSWLLQRTDPLYRAPTDRDLLAFCEVDVDNQVVDIVGFCDAKDIEKYELWADCKVPMFRRSKIALYLVNFSCYDVIRSELIKKES